MQVYDKTPYVGSIRGDDISAWFNRHPGDYRYVILDDDDDMDGHMEHLVQTEFAFGLTEEKADECICNTILLLKADKHASVFSILARRKPAGLLVASQGIST